MPHCELTDLVRDYRHQFQHLNRLAIEELTWHGPGRVWAMDHAEPPSPVDGLYDSLLSVRDLSSGMQLAWLPVPDQTAETTCDALLALFVEHGPPLVLKSDNGSAFISQLLAAMLRDWRVVPLRSPPALPAYNGSCEAGIGAMKIRTHYQAARSGRCGQWTCEDVEAARRRANEFHHPRRHRPSTSIDLWRSREAIDDHERRKFHSAIDRIRNELTENNQVTLSEPPTDAELAKLHRSVVRRALAELGILSTRWRSITLPIKPKKLARIS
jgi:transposase InsO family protein